MFTQTPTAKPAISSRRKDPERNGMNDYDRNTIVWNRSRQVQEHRTRRQGVINEITDTTKYRTGLRIHHLRSIQMHNIDTWNMLFRNETIAPEFQAYVTGSLDFVRDETDAVRFAGQMDVSLLMQENYRERVHLAVFFVHLSPHREFHDGHMIQVEFGEGSHTHQTINRLFDTATNAVVSQATEYQMLNLLALDADASELLHSCFLNDFNPMRFSYVQWKNDDADGHYINGHYIVDPEANDVHRWEQFGSDDKDTRSK